MADKAKKPAGKKKAAARKKPTAGRAALRGTAAGTGPMPAARKLASVMQYGAGMT